MTPYFIKGVTMFKAINKGLDTVGAVGGLFTDTVNAVGNGANIIKEKVNSSVVETQYEEATERVLMKVECVKRIMEALNCTWTEACEVLEEEVSRMKK